MEEKYFEEIISKTNGDSCPDNNFIDYENGVSISKKEIENEYEKYIDLQDEIDDYIEENCLDDVLDCQKIKEHFTNIEENLFEINQAVLINFVDYIVNKINNLEILKLTKEELSAIIKVLDYVDKPTNFEYIEKNLGEDITINFDNKDKIYVWYTDENNNVLMNIKTNEIIDEEEKINKIMNIPIN